MASLIRSWLIRGIILGMISAIAYAGWFATTWVSPEKVRAVVAEKLRQRLGPNIEVHVGEAHLRLFGGITVNDLRLSRQGEAEPFAVVPTAIISHDKERLHRGELAVRKIELVGPTLRITRNAGGDWSLPRTAGTDEAREALPTIVVRDATIWLSDIRPDGMPPVVLLDVRVQMVNDPLTLLKMDLQGLLASATAVGADGSVDPQTTMIPVNIAAKMGRPFGVGIGREVSGNLPPTGRSGGAISVKVSVPDLDLNSDFAPLLAKLHPKLGQYVMPLTARVALTVDLVFNGDPDRPVKYDVRVDLKDGRYEDPALPWPVENLSGSVQCQDGRVSVDKLTASLGKAKAEMTLRSKRDLLSCRECGRHRRYGPYIASLVYAEVLVRTRPSSTLPRFHQASDEGDDPIRIIEDALERCDLKLTGLSLDDELFARLTPQANRLRRMFSPTGGVNVNVRFLRTDLDGGWRREVDVRPNWLSIEYEKFKYRVSDLTGSLKKVTSSDGTDEFQVNLIGSMGGRRVEMSGKVAGEGPDPYIAMRIAGSDIPVDNRLFDALKPEYSAGLKKMRANARGDFVVDIRQDYSVNRAMNTFLIRVYNGTVSDSRFPYPFQQVRGHVRIRTEVSDQSRPLRPGQKSLAPDDTNRVEIKSFEAVHEGGRIWLAGEYDTVPGSDDRKLTLRVQGENCPIDADFRAAMKSLKLDGAMDAIGARGELTFGADLELRDRFQGSPSTPEEIDAAGADGKTTALKPALSSGGGSAVKPVVYPGSAPFTAEKDLKLAFHFKGPSVTPRFFPYEMHNLAGLMRYESGRLELVKLSARHGPTDLRLDAGEIRFADAGEVWANLGGISVAPLTTDAPLLKALPEKLRRGLLELNLRGPAELQVKHLVVRLPPIPPSTTLAGGEAAELRSSGRSGLESPAVISGEETTPKALRVRAQAPAPDQAESVSGDRWRPHAAASESTNLPAMPVPVRTVPGASAQTPPMPILPIAVRAKAVPPVEAQSRLADPAVAEGAIPKASVEQKLNPAAVGKSSGPADQTRAELSTEPGSRKHDGELLQEQNPAQPEVSKPADKEKPSRFPLTMPWQKTPLPARSPELSSPASPVPERPEPIIYWNATLKLNGGSMQAGLAWEDVYGSFASVGRYEGNHLGAVTGHAWFDKAVISRQPITSAKISYRIRPQKPDPLAPGSFLPPAIEFHDVTASIFRGTVGGEGRVVLGEHPAYKLRFTAAGVHLEDVAQHYKLATGAEVCGVAQAQIVLENNPDPRLRKSNLTGSGQIDVPRGRMYNLPVMLDLIKVLKGHVPDGCAFEEAHATFEVKGDRIRVTQLDLLGSAVSLGGSGETDLEGKQVKFEFYTIWSQTLKRWLSTPLGDITGMLSGSLFKIELTRENGKLTPKAHMLPVVTDPVRSVAERLGGRMSRYSDGHSAPVVPRGN